MHFLAEDSWFTIRPASHKGAKQEIPGSAVESASEGAVGFQGAPESAPEGAPGNWRCPRECSRGCSSCRGLTGREPSGALPGAPPISWSTLGSTFRSTLKSHSTLRSTFHGTSRDFPFSTLVAGRSDWKVLGFVTFLQ